jgi:hypothetical protein
VVACVEGRVAVLSCALVAACQAPAIPIAGAIWAHARRCSHVWRTWRDFLRSPTYRAKSEPFILDVFLDDRSVAPQPAAFTQPRPKPGVPFTPSGVEPAQYP